MTEVANDDELVPLVRAMAHGDRNALAALYDKLAGPLLALAQRLLPNSRDAEDLLQDVFFEVWKQAGSYDPERATVRSWIVMRLRSRASDRRRSAAARHVPTEHIDLAEAPIEDPGMGVDHARVHNVLSKLPAAQRRAMELVWVEGYTNAEAADIEAVPVGTMKSRLRFAMNALREALEERS
jgi:RNA polymerase sigma-70 factor (ECF subfamily)